MARKMLNKRSSIAGKMPKVSELEYGELAINYAEGKEFLSVLNSVSAVTTFDNTTSYPKGDNGEGGTQINYDAVALKGAETAETSLVSGFHSAAIGHGLQTSNQGEVAVGQFNETDEGVLFSVGKGTDAANRANALTVKSDGTTSVDSLYINNGDDVTLVINGDEVNLSDYIESVQVEIDDELSSSSTHPVQNKVIYEALDDLKGVIVEDELVTARALNDLNDRIENIHIDIDSELSSSSTNPVENQAITKVITDNERAIAAALTGLDSRVSENAQNITNTYNKTQVDSMIDGVRVTVDDVLSTASTNPVQNAVITQALNSIEVGVDISQEAGNIIEEKSDGIYVSNAGILQNAADIAELSGNVIDNEYVISSALNNLKLELDEQGELIDTLEGSSHTHGNKDVLDNITSDEVSNWNNAASQGITGITVNGGSAVPVTNGVAEITVETPTAIDSSLSTASTNPVQNKVITEALNEKANAADTYTKTEAQTQFLAKTGDTGHGSYAFEMDLDESFTVGKMGNNEKLFFSAHTSNPTVLGATTEFLFGHTLVPDTSIQGITMLMETTPYNSYDAPSTYLYGGLYKSKSRRESGALNTGSTDIVRYITEEDYATSTQAGVVKIGTGLSAAADGTISVTGGTGDVTVDSTLSTASTNPVQNAAIATALNAKADVSALGDYLPKTGFTYSANDTTPTLSYDGGLGGEVTLSLRSNSATGACLHASQSSLNGGAALSAETANGSYAVVARGASEFDVRESQSTFVIGDMALTPNRHYFTVNHEGTINNTIGYDQEFQLQTYTDTGAVNNILTATSQHLFVNVGIEAMSGMNMNQGDSQAPAPISFTTRPNNGHGNTGGISFSQSDGTNSRVYAQMGGSIDPNGSDPLYGLSATTVSAVTGGFTNLTVTNPIDGTLHTPSDRSLKDNIEDICECDSEKLFNVSLKSFVMKDDEEKRKRYGVIAQDLEEAGLGELVYTNEDTKLKSVDYTGLLILKVSQLEKEIEKLKQKLDKVVE